MMRRPAIGGSISTSSAATHSATLELAEEEDYLSSSTSTASRLLTHPLLDPSSTSSSEYESNSGKYSDRGHPPQLPLPPPPQLSPSTIRSNFHKMSIAFAINHGCSVSVLGLSAARLGSIGIWMSSMLYASYTIAALYGASMIVERYCRSSSRNGLALGMALCSSYVTAFFVMALLTVENREDGESDGTSTTTTTTTTPEWYVHLQIIVAVGGAVVGGVGSSVLWVSQGTYFARASQLFAALETTTTRRRHANAILLEERYGDGRTRRREEDDDDDGWPTAATTTAENVTGKFGGNFAFIFLAFEVVLRLLSTFLIQTAGLSWRVIFGVYSLLSILPVCFMMSVLDLDGTLITNTNTAAAADGAAAAAVIRPTAEYGTQDSKPRSSGKEENQNEEEVVVADANARLSSNKATATLDLLWQDSKARYMAPMSVLFGISTSFCSSVINGEVIQKVLSDPNSTYVGLYTAVTSLVAAAASYVFGRLQSSSSSWQRGGRKLRCGKVVVLTIGALSYLVIAVQFLAFPGGKHWNRTSLLFLYILLGIGRATYEGTLRAVFADYFPNNKEGAFGNIILWSGSASTIGYVLSVTGALQCDTAGPYCLEYTDGSRHNVLLMEVVIIALAVIAIPAFWRANWIFVKDRMIC